MTNYTTNAAYPYPTATDQLVDYPTTAASLAGYLDFLPNRNVIINGAFDVWQRGLGAATVLDGNYTADRWRYAQLGAGGTRTVVAVNAPTGTDLIGGNQARYFLRLNTTVVGSATSQIIGQRIENVRTLAGKQCTLSAWIKGTATGVTAKAVQNFGTGGTPSSAVSTTLGTATPTAGFVRIHVHFTMPNLAAKTIGTNEDSFVEIQFDIGSSLGTLDLWGVQLEQNTTQTVFETESIQQTLAKCYRYFQRYSYSNGNQYVPQHPWQIDTLNRPAMALIYSEKRVAPVITISSAVTFNIASITSAASGSPSAFLGTLIGTKLQSAVIYWTQAWALNTPAIISLGPGAYIDISAEL